MTDRQSYHVEDPMIERLRATRERDKLERRNDILDAAERLLVERPSELASMDELAQAAGVAKGTLYLYFPSKEEVLLALHHRQADTFLAALDERIGESKRFTLDDLFELVRVQILESQSFLPVSTLVAGYTERSIPLESVIRFRSGLGAKLTQSGTALEGALSLPPGSGPRLLQYSFALMVGLWQITSCGRFSKAMEHSDAHVAAFIADFPAELRQGLNMLWAGAVRDGAQRARTTAIRKSAARRSARSRSKR